MAEENQEINAVDPANLVVKRKRGRPRKDSDPGSESAKRRQVRKADHTSNVDNISVGQAVYGFLDGKFDAGYMLTVKVGDSDTVLSGVVFEPGRCVPVSAANDIAPNATMMERANFSIPNVQNVSQPIPKKETAITLKETPVKSMPEDLNSKPATWLTVDKSVTDNEFRVPSDVSVKYSSSSPCEPARNINLNNVASPRSSACEPKEIQMSDSKKPTQLVSEGTAKSQFSNPIPEVTAPSSTSNPEAKTDKIDGNHGNTQVEAVETVVLLAEGAKAVEQQKEKTLSFLEAKGNPVPTSEPPAVASSSVTADKIPVTNMSTEATKFPEEQKTDNAAQVPGSEPQAKDHQRESETQHSVLQPQAPSSTTGHDQPMEATEARKDLNLAAADQDSNMGR